MGKSVVATATQMASCTFAANWWVLVNIPRLCRGIFTEFSVDEKDTAVVDLLANLRRYCDHYRFDFSQLDRLAYQHYVAELNSD